MELRRPFIDNDLDLAPYSAFHVAVLAAMPLSFVLGLHVGAIDRLMQRPLRTTLWNVHSQGLLTMALPTEVGQREVQGDQTIGAHIKMMGQ